MSEPSKPPPPTAAELGVLFEQSSRPVLVIDPETNRIVIANDAAVRVYGYSHQELEGLRLEELGGGADFPTERQPLSPSPSAVGGATRRSGARHRRRDGSMVDVEVTFEDFDWGERRLRLALVQNVTARHRASDRLDLVLSVTAALGEAITAEQVARAVVDQGVAALGAHSGSLALVEGDGELLRIVRAVGYDEAVVRRWERVSIEVSFPPADAVRGRAPIFLATAEERASRYPHLADLRSANGAGAMAALPLMVEGRVIGSFSLNFPPEFTLGDDERALILNLAQQTAQALERSSLYAALARSRDDARLLAEASRTLASSLHYEKTLASVARLAVPAFADWCAVDLVLPDGSISRVATIHWDPARLAWAAEIIDEVAPRLDDAHGIGQVIRTGEPIFVPEVNSRIIREMALSERHVEILEALGLASTITVPMAVRDRTFGALTFLQAESGRHYGEGDLKLALELGQRSAVAVENARLYSAEQEARAEAERASRAKSQFLAIMSHELRTPLNAIIGYADLLDAEIAGGLSEQQHTHVDRIQESANHLRELIDQVLSLAKIEAGRAEVRLEEIDLAGIIEESVSIVQPLAAQKGLEIRRAPTEGPLPVRTDPAKVRQILLNLLGNAIKYADVGFVEVEVRESPERIVLRVKDTGVGISPADLERIFEPFTQVDQSTTRRVGGSGLGLPISQQLARLLGGSIEVESEPGKGSTFTLSLPRYPTD